MYSICICYPWSYCVPSCFYCALYMMAPLQIAPGFPCCCYLVRFKVSSTCTNILVYAYMQLSGGIKPMKKFLIPVKLDITSNGGL